MSTIDLNIRVKDIVPELSAGDAVFYVGAGFSMVAGMPGWKNLLEELISILEKSAESQNSDVASNTLKTVEAAKNAKNRGEFQYVASLLAMGLDRSVINRHVASRFSIKSMSDPTINDRINQRLENLTRAPIAGIITTNYDNLIESHDEFRQRFATVALSSIDLPNLFKGRERDKRYFLKIHGDLHGEIVLSSEDYDRVYLSSPRAEHFLRSSLMQNPMVFLGCSIEDAILRQRRLLFELYGNGLPPCYQVTSRSTESEVRAAWLMNYAGIQSIFYDASTHEHLEFDDFLSDLTDQMIKQNLQLYGHRPSRIIREALGGPVAMGPEALGETNFAIRNIVHGSPNSSCSYLQLLEEITLQFPLADLESMVYRIAFLISIGALIENDDNEIVLTAP